MEGLNTNPHDSEDSNTSSGIAVELFSNSSKPLSSDEIESMATFEGENDLSEHIREVFSPDNMTLSGIQINEDMLISAPLIAPYVESFGLEKGITTLTSEILLSDPDLLADVLLASSDRYRFAQELYSIDQYGEKSLFELASLSSETESASIHIGLGFGDIDTNITEERPGELKGESRISVAPQISASLSASGDVSIGSINHAEIRIGGDAQLTEGGEVEGSIGISVKLLFGN